MQGTAVTPNVHRRPGNEGPQLADGHVPRIGHLVGAAQPLPRGGGNRRRPAPWQPAAGSWQFGRSGRDLCRASSYAASTRGACAACRDEPEGGGAGDDVTDTLEREGVDKFSDSFAELLEGIRAKSGELAPA